jgi:chromate reductase, NAD(P)H dehydrogenase (quinone)
MQASIQTQHRSRDRTVTAHPNLLFFAGSARAGSFNKRLAQLGASISRVNGIHATFADLGDYPMPLYDGDTETASGVPDNARKLLALMQANDGIFIASPEYNASMSPLLKNTLDWISRIRDDGNAGLAVYKTRVFALGAASPGGTGGMRGLVAVRNVLEMGLGALVLPDQVLVPRATTAFDDNGHLTDKDAQDRFKAVIQKLARVAKIAHADEAAHG